MNYIISVFCAINITTKLKEQIVLSISTCFWFDGNQLLQ